MCELPQQSLKFPAETHSIIQSEVTFVLLSVKFCPWNFLPLELSCSFGTLPLYS